jgi:hypothetical protein
MAALKKVYNVIALLALLHLVGVAGVLAFLIGTGRLTAADAKEIAHTLRVEAPAEAGPPDQTAKASTAEAATEAEPLPGSTEAEIRRRNLERIAMQAEHQLILANRQMLDVKRRQEELDQQVAAAEAEQKQLEQERTDEGFKKDIELLSMLKPTVALDSLLARPVDEAARIMMEMDTRQGKKIIEAAAKEPRKWSGMLRIQRRLRDLSPEAADQLDQKRQ